MKATTEYQKAEAARLMKTIHEARAASRLSYLPIEHLREAFLSNARRFDNALRTLVAEQKVILHGYDRPYPPANVIWQGPDGRPFGGLVIAGE